MKRRLITMNLKTGEVSYADMTAQELAELRAISEDYRRLYGTQRRVDEVIDRDEVLEVEKMARSF